MRASAEALLLCSQARVPHFVHQPSTPKLGIFLVREAIVLEINVKAKKTPSQIDLLNHLDSMAKMKKQMQAGGLASTNLSFFPSITIKAGEMFLTRGGPGRSVRRVKVVNGPEDDTFLGMNTLTGSPFAGIFLLDGEFVPNDPEASAWAGGYSFMDIVQEEWTYWREERAWWNGKPIVYRHVTSDYITWSEFPAKETLTSKTLKFYENHYAFRMKPAE